MALVAGWRGGGGLTPVVLVAGWRGGGGFTALVSVAGGLSHGGGDPNSIGKLLFDVDGCSGLVFLCLAVGLASAVPALFGLGVDHLQ